MNNKRFNDDYNKEYFYLTFETKLIWIIIGMIFSMIFKDGWMISIILFIYMCYGLYKKNKILMEIEDKKKKK